MNECILCPHCGESIDVIVESTDAEDFEIGIFSSKMTLTGVCPTCGAEWSCRAEFEPILRDIDEINFGEPMEEDE